MDCVSKVEVLKKIEWELRLLIKNPKVITENSRIYNKERRPGDFNTHNTKWKNEVQGNVVSNLPGEFVWRESGEETKSGLKESTIA